MEWLFKPASVEWLGGERGAFDKVASRPPLHQRACGLPGVSESLANAHMNREDAGGIDVEPLSRSMVVKRCSRNDHLIGRFSLNLAALEPPSACRCPLEALCRRVWLVDEFAPIAGSGVGETRRDEDHERS